MATSTDAAGAIPDQENRVTLRDPIRESEGWLLQTVFNIKF